ncbi:reduced folate carrier domain-containing protein [Ditylenchus destructor]|uniref:Reduced folate carrier domain-containing protein n=1 Tax=Ditylenchus destructor TaxID=166010 RepID=A0AAD4R4Q3_9BILA|nr:reduced folate carrier domain-containing protein [Ditylenchus destructor]
MKVKLFSHKTVNYETKAGDTKKGNLDPFAASEWPTNFNHNETNSKWATKWLPALLCFYAVFKEIKVAEPYAYKYQTEYLNITAAEMTAEVYPVVPYTYLFSLVPIFLLTDLFLYKPTMIVEMIGQIVFRSTQVFGFTVTSQIVGHSFYAVASACEVAFFSYIYAVLEKDQYRKLTGWTRAAVMAGRSSGYIFGQFLVLSHVANLRILNIISFCIPCVVFLMCVFLPRVHWKQMVYRMLEAKSLNDRKASILWKPPQSYLDYLTYRIRKLRSDFVKTYSVGFIRKWSLWWAMTTCMSLQVALYAQSLWGEVPSGDSPLNGFADAAYTATAALAILAMNAFPLDWDKWGELALVIISTIDASLLVVYSRTQNINVMYLCYISYRSLYQVMITIAQWNIAKKMKCESYGLVFGTNTFVALVMQSILMMVVSDKRGPLSLPVRHQYLVYAGLHFIVAIIFLCSVIVSIVRYLRRSKAKVQPTEESSDETETISDSGSDVAKFEEALPKQNNLQHLRRPSMARSTCLQYAQDETSDETNIESGETDKELDETDISSESGSDNETKVDKKIQKSIARN